MLLMDMDYRLAVTRGYGLVDKGWREGSHLETNNGRNRVVSSIFSFLVLEDEETEAQIY